MRPCRTCGADVAGGQAHNIPWMVHIFKAAPEGRASCDEPNCTVLSVFASRNRVRVHAQHTGHTARYVVETTTVYRPTKPDEVPR